MNLKDVNLLSLQTKYMQLDKTTQALCAALTPQFRQMADDIKACLIYARVNELNSEVLDELAWQMNIDWYDPTADIDVRRTLIKNALKIYQFRGTPYAVEQVIQDYFGDGAVEEWFEYNGDPYHFQVVTSNSAVTGELATQFTQAVEKVKRLSTILDQVIVSMTAEFNLYIGNVIQTGDFITVEQVV